MAKNWFPNIPKDGKPVEAGLGFAADESYIDYLTRQQHESRKREPEPMPDYSPPQPLAVWLSSEEIIALIHKIRRSGTSRKACWDFYSAVTRLMEQKQYQIPPPNEVGEEK